MWIVKKQIFLKVYKWNISNWYLDIVFYWEAHGVIVFLNFEQELIFRDTPSKFIP